MKGAYLTIVDTASKNSHGVIQKIKSQVLAFEKLGCIMDFYHFHNQGVVKNGKSYANKAKKNLLSKVTGDTYLYNLFLENDVAETYDFIYIRYPKASPWLISFLKKLKKQNPDIKIITEVPTYPYENQWKTLKSKLIQQLDYLYRGKLKKYVDRIVTFYGQNEIFDIKTIKIGNGINTEQAKIIPRVAASGANLLRLVCIANLKFYHGYDRVIEGIAKNDTDYQIIFNVVGGGPEEASLKALAKSLNVEKQIKFHGFQFGEQLNKIIANSDLAIGTLGWHRAGVSMDSALKTREYCSNGIPFVMSNADQDFNTGFPYMLRVPETDEPVSIKQLVDFYEKCYNDVAYQQQMNDYAKENLDWQVQVKEILYAIKKQ